MRYTITKLSRRTLAATAAAFVLLSGGASYAGFEWIPPVPPAPAAPVAPVSPAIPAPENSVITPEPVPPVSPQPLKPQEAAISPEPPAAIQAAQSPEVKAAESLPLIPAMPPSAPAPQKPAENLSEAIPSAPPAPPAEKKAQPAEPVLKTLIMAPPAQPEKAQEKPAQEAAVPANPEVEAAPPAQKAAVIIAPHDAPDAQKPMKRLDPPPQQVVAPPADPEAIQGSAPMEAENARLRQEPQQAISQNAEPPQGMPPLAGLPPESKKSAAEKLVINPFPENQTQSNLPPQAKGSELSAKNEAVDFGKSLGFGADMPLALALQQIAPPNYAFAFGESVNPGVRVSWDGEGRPWNEVLEDTLRPHNLKAEVRGNVIHIAVLAPKLERQGSLSASEEGAAGVQAESSRLEPLNAPGAAAIEPASGAATQQQPLSPPLPLYFGPEEEAPKPLLEPQPSAEDANTEEHTEWRVRQGDSLKETLGAWSRKANVELLWSADHDYTIEADITVNGSFKNAVETVIDRGLKTDGKPFAEFRAEQGKAGVLVLTSA